MNNINKSSIKILQSNFNFFRFKIKQTLIDETDETTKFLFELADGEKIETVLMKFNYGYSICISTQVGCNMGCKFCASGLLKMKRNLETYEIVEQFMCVNDYLVKNKSSKISNIVVMGIGEPLNNYDNLSMALRIFIDHHGIGIGSRHITVSTCGVVNRIMTFANDFPQINLAISLHASNDKVRNSIMPINQKYNLKCLFDVLRKYHKQNKRKITFEYLLLKDINDSKTDALELVKLIKDLTCYVNLIIYNQISEHSFEKSINEHEFAKILISKGINVTTRAEKGIKINAACGQLRAIHEN
jgi:23S rRNA (adenine2503-C2)-methyltransferase